MADAQIQAAATALLDLCKARKVMVATAESCTGGLVAGALTDIAGSSAVVDRGFVTYTNEAKHQMLGVPSDTLNRFGAVSRETAEAMARGALGNANADIVVAITGIAGPGGGTESKPVGMVCIAVALDETVARTFKFPGNRELIKTFAAFTAVDMVRRRLLGAAANADWLQK